MSAPGATPVLAGTRVVEFAGIGPAPHAALILADLGAEVVRVERPDTPHRSPGTVRNRHIVTLDLKSDEDRGRLWELLQRADVVLEGFRPGVMEKLGLGPEQVAARFPDIVYARLTGWGQSGPLAERAGHDINFLALSGVLHGIGRPGERPVPPINLMGDFGGGSLPAVVGILAALLRRTRSGEGAVVDAAVVDGTANLSNMIWSLLAEGRWVDRPGENLYDGGAPYYDTYECRDGRYIAVGAVEEPFYRQLLTGLGLDGETLPDRHDRAVWPQLRERFAAVFRTRNRDDWAAVFEDGDACVTPVLSFGEAPEHPHLRARAVFHEWNGAPMPYCAPKIFPLCGMHEDTLREGEYADR